jgi:hypothetical protein
MTTALMTSVIGLDRGTTDLEQLEHDVLLWAAESSPGSEEIATHIIDGHYVASVSVAAGDELDALKAASAFGFIVSGLSDLEPIDVVSSEPLRTDSAPVARARDAAVAHLMRLGGRLIRFRGCERNDGNEVPVAELLASTAIDEVTPLGAELADDAIVVSNGFLRPTMGDGRTTLIVTQIDQQRVAPFETENPPRSC